MPEVEVLRDPSAETSSPHVFNNVFMKCMKPKNVISISFYHKQFFVFEFKTLCCQDAVVPQLKEPEIPPKKEITFVPSTSRFRSWRTGTKLLHSKFKFDDELFEKCFI